jgi:ketosteroid isomerase-like protein
MATVVTGEVDVEFLRAFADAWNRHDIEDLMSFMADECVFEPSTGPNVYGTRYEGRDEVRAGFLKVFEVTPDGRWSNDSHFVSGDRGVSQWTFTGTLADGSRIETNGCDIFTFKDGKIAVKDSYRKNRTV